MFKRDSASSPLSCWYARRIPHIGTGPLSHSGIPTRIYDAMLLFLVILAVTHHMLGRGILLAAFLVCRLVGRRLAHIPLTSSAPSGPDRGQCR
ncbi:hypothetical protein ABTY63_22995 [Streptomyces solisilvae]|uniref:hypothetical protein n=1 Tax=Streptomyces malaysiensis TaxID=92644 RepID=UPI0033244735